MDSDAVYLSEDEHSLRRTKHVAYGHSWPSLTHYDKLWARETRWGPYKEFKEISGPGGETSIVNDEHFRFARLKAFFRSLKGFYTGRSDLTGRFHALTVTVEPYQDEWVDYLDKKHEYTNYRMTDEELWKKFQEKWLLPVKVDYAFLVDMAESVRTKISDGTQPKFQMHLLYDLPDELLDVIYRHADLTGALFLSATCRRMRAISLPFIYTSRDLGLRQSLKTLILPQHVSAEAQKEHAIKVLLKASIRALEDAHFLLSRPDITSKFQSINVFNNWSSNTHLYHPDFPPSLFIPSISHAVCVVLHHTVNVTSLSMFGFPLQDHVFQAIAILPSLRTLKLTGCPVESTMGPQLVRVKNLAVHVLDEEGLSTWEILTLFPNAVNISFFDTSRSMMELSDSVTLNHLGHLTRLCLGNLAGETFPDIIHFLHHTTEYHLTHLKLTFTHPIDDVNFFVLLDELQPHPMENLVIDGLLEGNPAIIRHVSRCLPGLTALSLYRRESQRQQKTRVTCSWPLPPFEYAPCFSMFSKLRYFEWNCALNFGVTSWSILTFEGNDNCGPCGAPYKAWKSKDDDPDDDDSKHLLASVFAAYNPSLQTVTVGSGRISPMASWSISHEGGDTIIEAIPMAKLYSSAQEIWNPTEYKVGIETW
ncbi:uncharacterized protein EV420DRAFT_1566898 [Desarmillaria tabescens]|uniref:F-box domain-containing protein n=1 Tax=Armillaria tabescens TaxID=1929756 RepID=A0AA39JTD4_ARMTA|nr:uncharacterized protein EV420DRAFT_1566898 [Desarmillaria tabescens]KAK0448463.1 hypothetical protein EV420DRAFT_1566898 [Desarmillaria tabescens]